MLPLKCLSIILQNTEKYLDSHRDVRGKCLNGETALKSPFQFEGCMSTALQAYNLKEL